MEASISSNALPSNQLTNVEKNCGYFVEKKICIWIQNDITLYSRNKK